MPPSPAQTDSKIITWDSIPAATDVPDLPVEWLCDRLIPRAGITLLAGEPSACKTWLALALAKAVSDGGQFLGLQCDRAPVLYLDRENPASVIRDRLARIGVDFTASHRHANFKYWGGWQAEAPPGIGDFRLEEMSLRGPFIILDPFVRFHGGDENSASEMARVMAELRKLAFRGASVLAIHHKSKAEASKYRGSSDIAAGVDVGIALSKDDASGILTLRAFKNRMGTDFTYNVRPDFSPEAVCFTLTDPPRG
jgi:RecA-family ATPase